MVMMTFRDARLLVAAGATTAAIRVALWTVPFRAVRAAVSRLAASRPRRSDDHGTLERIIWSVHVASRFVPRATCLTQSLAAEILLKRHGYHAELRLGVAREGEQFDAHAWVESNGRVVIGNIDLSRYTAMHADSTRTT
jgi:hypothetical protein